MHNLVPTGKSILLAVILTATVVVSLTIYTFWAVKRGQDFSFLGPFLFAATLMLMMFGLIQVTQLYLISIFFVPLLNHKSQVMMHTTVIQNHSYIN